MGAVLRKISDLVQLMLQWLLVLWGAFLFLMAYVVYMSDHRRLNALKEADSQAPATGDGYVRLFLMIVANQVLEP